MDNFALQLTLFFLCGLWNIGVAEPENCFNEVYRYSGHITSLNYPEPYPSGRNCTWIISTLSFYQLQLNFSTFDLEYHESCGYDYLTVYDGSSTEDKVIGKFCGSSVPSYPLISSKNIVMINFYSDSTKQGRGFNITYDSALCGANFVQLKGHFMGPSYPDNYPIYKKCFWSIETSNDLQVSLNLSFVQPSSSSNCSTEFIKIFSLAPTVNGFSGQKSLGASSAIPLAFICSKKEVLQQNTAIVDLRSVFNKMFIIYESLSPIQSLHFKVSFSSVPCGGVYKKDEGTIGVNYQENYGRNVDCLWTLEVPKGHQVTLHSTYLNINDSSNCTTNYLEIRDGLNDFSPLLMNRICGTEIPNVVFSSSNTMWVRLKLGASTSAKGFVANFAKVCGGNVSMVRGYDRLNSHATFGYEDYSHDINCSWRLYEYKARNFLLRFKFFELESGSCNYDYLEIFEGPDANGPRIGKYCGNSIPNDVVSNGSNLYLHFKTDGSTAKRGFSLLII